MRLISLVWLVLESFQCLVGALFLEDGSVVGSLTFTLYLNKLSSESMPINRCLCRKMEQCLVVTPLLADKFFGLIIISVITQNNRLSNL